MNYGRIYREFIQDRRLREHGLTGYVERHHIMPRSLGGGDEPENLINLSAEDHFFAHLLLAKIHGGKMGNALFCMLMVTNNHWGRRLASRSKYGLAKRIASGEMSEAWTGDRNPLFNSHQFEWQNYRTGERETATLSHMHSKYGASRASWTSVATGDRPSIKGWVIADRLAGHKRSEKGQVFTFVNRNGDTFTGTQGQFCQHAGLSVASASRIARASSVSKCGWRLGSAEDRHFTSRKDGKRSRKVPSIFTLQKGNALLKGDRTEIAAALGSTVTQISASMHAMSFGKVATYKGWVLVKKERADEVAA